MPRLAKKPKDDLQVVYNDPLKCRKCGSENWSYITSYETVFNSATNTEIKRRFISGEGIRCSNCRLNATLKNRIALKMLEIYNLILRIEETKK